jgi:uncharacterized membrane protein
LIWMGHHNIFNKIYRSNRTIVLLNGLVLMFVVLFPFPTRTVGNFIGTEAVNTAVAFYAGFTGIIVLCMLLLNLAIIRNYQILINPDKSLPWLKVQVKQQLMAILIYAVAAIVAFYAPAIALIITFLMWVFWAFVSKITDDEK